MPRQLVCRLLLLVPVQVLSVAVNAAGHVDDLRQHALAKNRAWELLESLTTEVGARPVGSHGMTLARDWAVSRLVALGFSNVHAEPFVKENAWVRGTESAFVLAPASRPLAVTALGNSVPTPAT